MNEAESSPSRLSQIVAEVLADPIPYTVQPNLSGEEGFYMVCDYRAVPLGTVIVYFRARELAAHVYGYLPQATLEERAALHAIITRHITEGGCLDTESIRQSMLRVLPEEDAVQRLLEVQRLLGNHKTGLPRPSFH